MNGIEITHLQAFVALADHQHFGHAAEELGLAQPGLSKRIALLEARLGAELFHRNKSASGVKLTRAGMMLYRTAPELLERIQLALEQARLAAQGKAGLVRLGYSSLSMATVLPSALANLRAAFPQIVIQLNEGNSRELNEGLKGDVLDLAFPLNASRDHGDQDQFIVCRLLHESPIGIVLPTGHRLAGTATVAIEELENESFILFPRRLNPVVYDNILEACMKAGFHPNIVAERSPREAAIAEVAAGNGVTFLTSALSRLVTEGTTHRELSGEFVPSIRVYAIWKSTQSPLIVSWLKAMFPNLAFPAN